MLLRGAVGTAADLAITRLIQRVEAPGFELAMILVSAFGFSPLNWPLLPAALIGFGLAGFRREALFIALTPGAAFISATVKLLVGLVGVSRIYLGHHWASDVLGGYALGTAYLVILAGLYRLTSRRVSAPTPAPSDVLDRVGAADARP